MINETLLEQELEPHRQWRTAQLTMLENIWAGQLSAIVARVAKAIAPLAVSDAWVQSLRTERRPETREHFRRVAALDEEFMKRTQSIWDKYLGALCS